MLAVSGGSTPKLFFEKLSQMDIPWTNVTVTLVDERQAPESSERSNARLVRGSLLQNQAAAAKFVPLYQNPEALKIEKLDVVVLGMGLDGHTASFFPGGNTLAAGLDSKGSARIIDISAPGSGEPRLTFTLPVLLGAKKLILHIEGTDKRKVLDKALGEGTIEEMPVRAVLRSEAPVALYWCR